MVFFLRELRTHKSWGPALVWQPALLGIFNLDAKAKINQLGLLGFPIDENIFEFQIPVNHPFRVHILYRLYNFGENFFDIIFVAYSLPF